MRALYLQFGVLIGVLGFLSQMINGSTAKSALLDGSIAGGAVLVVLVAGDAFVHFVLRRIYLNEIPTRSGRSDNIAPTPQTGVEGNNETGALAA